MERVIQLSVLFFSVLFANCDDFDYCYAKDGKPYELFSTWTRAAAVWSYVEIKESACKPIYLWAVLKHGVRSFTDEQIHRSENLNDVKRDVEQNNKEKRCALCADDIQNILSSSATFKLDKGQNENLAKQAYSTHELYASHLRQRMESAPSFSFSKNDVEIQTSEAKEAKDSAIKFLNTFLRTNDPNSAGNGITENKALLRTRSNCAKWTANNKESEDFTPSLSFQSTRLEVSNRLGFTQAIPMEKITAMYESCVFWHFLPTPNKPPFCAAFTPDNLKTMEYWQDLKHYYEFGYGNPLSEKIGCPLVKEMIDKLSTASTGTFENNQGTVTVSKWTGKRVNIYVADEENIMGMITKMGLYRDDVAPKHDNYNTQKTTRKWRSSLLDPFASSMHLVLYQCNNNEKKVELYHNHDLVTFDGCKNVADGKCPLDAFMTEVKKNLADKCDEDFCGSFPSKASGGNVINCSFIIMIACFFFNRL